MCDMDDGDWLSLDWGEWPIQIRWNGFTATPRTLAAAGWTHQARYGDWRHPAKRTKLYFRHPETRMIARVTLDSPNAKRMGFEDYSFYSIWTLDFMTHERNWQIKAKRVVDEEMQVTEDDIGPLLEAIAQVQEKRPRRHRGFPDADIIDMPRKIA